MRATRASLPSDVMAGSVAAFRWQRAQLSRAWHIAHCASAPSDAGACDAIHVGSLCDAGIGKDAIELSLNATALTSGTWHVSQRASLARCVVALCAWQLMHSAGGA